MRTDTKRLKQESSCSFTPNNPNAHQQESGRQTVAYLHNGVLHSYKKEHISETRNNMNLTVMLRERSYTQESRVPESARIISENRGQNSGELGWIVTLDLEEAQKTFQGDGTFCILV